MATPSVEYLPPPLDATAQQPAIFDGTIRLYLAYPCPYAQRVWIARNCKGLQDKIKLVPLNLQNRPAWYKEKVYPENKDADKKEYFETLLSHMDEFLGLVYATFKGDSTKDADAAFDHLETALAKYDGPFLLGNEFTLADIAFIPFVERFQIYLSEVFNYDLTAGRPKVAAWIEAADKIDAYKQTKKSDPKEIVEIYKRIFSAQK
uniref:GST C-terminal domain-containing protein n=1 Tax=Gossypium raimondii TaxID=29730 RepID=A0A0D2QBY3_GOSRA|nr:hypothetical protein B456_006G177600 [Gossypium raimondii]